MRICFLLHQGSMYSGGQGIYLAALTRELAALGHEVHAVCGPPYPVLDERVRLHRLPSYHVYAAMEEGARFWQTRPPPAFFSPLNFYEWYTTRNGLFSVMFAFSLRAAVKVLELQREAPFDVVHDNQSLGYGNLVLRRAGIPVVATVHHPLTLDRRNGILQGRTLGEKLRKALFYPLHMQRVALHDADAVVTVSNASRRAVADAFGLDEGRIEVVWNGVDTEVFRPLPAVEPEPGSLLFVGNSDDRNKGALYLMRALALLKDAQDFSLTVVDRHEAELVPRLAAELGLAGRVRFAGRLAAQELPNAYNRAQVFVSPSVFEGFGLPAAEAMACGRPVVATTAGAFPEVIADGETGVLVPCADEAALAVAISRLLNDPAQCERMGAAGRRRAVEQFTWNRAALQLERIYERVRAQRLAGSAVEHYRDG